MFSSFCILCITNHVFAGGTHCFWFCADSSADMGLLVLRGLKNPVPCSSDTDPPQPGFDSTGPVPARRLPNLQADDPRTICWWMPHFYAGRRRTDYALNTLSSSELINISCNFFNPIIVLFLAFPRKSSLNQEVSPWQPWLSCEQYVDLALLQKSHDPDLHVQFHFTFHCSAASSSFALFK